jgi:hypothetical protein
MKTGFEAIFSKLGRVDAKRFIMLIKRDKFDYTEWQKTFGRMKRWSLYLRRHKERGNERIIFNDI